MPVQFIGLKDFTPEETEIITDISEHYHEKLRIKVKKFLIKAHPKKHDKTGNRTKYTLHLRLETPSILAVSEAYDWDLSRVMHECFKKLKREIDHKLKLEGHVPKPK